LQHADTQLQMFLVTAEYVWVVLLLGTGRLQDPLLILPAPYYPPRTVFLDERLDEAFAQ
jgi:hypothetical protein